MSTPELVYKTYIRSTPQKTWDAITQPQFTRQYWGEMANISDWKQGSEWQHVNKDDETWITGKVVESISPKRLVLTWADPDDLEDESRVTFEIEPVDDIVCLIVTHDQFKAGSEMAGKVSKGWPHVLSSLKSFLETGTGLSVGCGS